MRAILQTARHSGGRGGERPARPWGDGAGVRPAGGPVGGEDGAGSAGGVGGTRPDRRPGDCCRDVCGGPVQGDLTRPICRICDVLPDVRTPRWRLVPGPCAAPSREAGRCCPPDVVDLIVDARAAPTPTPGRGRTPNVARAPADREGRPAQDWSAAVAPRRPASCRDVPSRRGWHRSPTPGQRRIGHPGRSALVARPSLKQP
jgi:hypothetical protein